VQLLPWARAFPEAKKIINYGTRRAGNMASNAARETARQTVCNKCEGKSKLDNASNVKFNYRWV